MAEYYSVELAQKVKRGMTENALACRWASGRIPFGYTIDADKHLHPDPALVPIVQEAFEMYAAGAKIVDIARKSTVIMSSLVWVINSAVPALTG